MTNQCVVCGTELPEGGMVCRKCRLSEQVNTGRFDEYDGVLPKHKIIRNVLNALYPVTPLIEPQNKLMRHMYGELAAGRCMNHSVEWELCLMTDREIIEMCGGLCGLCGGLCGLCGLCGL